MRYWRGWASPENADAYERIVTTQVLPHLAGLNLDGYHGAYLMRREAGDEVEFATITIFDSLDDVRAFAGEDYERAFVPEEARAVLTRFDGRCAHYETLLSPGSYTVAFTCQAMSDMPDTSENIVFVKPINATIVDGQTLTVAF